MIYEVDTFLRIHSKRLSKQQIVSPKFQMVQKNPRRGLQGRKVQSNHESEVKTIKKFPKGKITYHNYYQNNQPQPNENKTLLKIFDYLDAAHEIQMRGVPTSEEEETQNQYDCLSSTKFKFKRAESAHKVFRNFSFRKSLKIQTVQINPFPQQRQSSVYKTISRPLTAKNIQRDRSPSQSKPANPLSVNIKRFLKQILATQTKTSGSHSMRMKSAAKPLKSYNPLHNSTLNYQQANSVDCNKLKKYSRRKIFQLLKSKQNI